MSRGYPVRNAKMLEFAHHYGLTIATCVPADAGMFTEDEIGTTCCFATQDKVWVTGPAGEKWEVYTVLADSDTFGTSPVHLDADGEGGVCCGGQATEAAQAVAAGTPSTSCC